MWQGTAITRRSNTHVARNINNQKVEYPCGKEQRYPEGQRLMWQGTAITIRSKIHVESDSNSWKMANMYICYNAILYVIP